MTVLEALSRITTDHELLLLDIDGSGASVWAKAGLPLIDVQAILAVGGPAVPEVRGVETAARKLGLDVVWYLDPAAEVLSVPVFATVLDLAHRQHPFFPEVSGGLEWEAREKHYSAVLPRAARIFTGTQVGKDQVVRCYGVNPTSVVVNPLPTPVLARPDDNLDDDEVLVRHALKPGFLFYPAQLWSHKNHVNLLLALKRLETEQGLSPELVLTGTDKGNSSHVLGVATELGLQQRVHFLGFVSNSDVAALYRCAAALVYPSFFGPDNLPPLEAFSLGCPVLAGRIEGVEEQLGNAALEPMKEEVVWRFRSLSNLLLKRFQRSAPESPPDPRKSGFAGYFDPTQPEDIAAAIARVLCDVDFRTTLIEYGHALVAKRTPEAYVQVVLDALDEFEPWRRNWPASVFQAPLSVSRFPTDLVDPALMYAGVYVDGWLSQSSFFVLRAEPESVQLAVRGEVPLIGDSNFSTELSISMDGQPLVLAKFDAGKFEIMTDAPNRQGLHRIELSFSNLQRLPDPDLRLIGARLEFIGFKDAAALPESTE
ncbi:MAG TPA: glycosyltransferase family 1 protein [Xanthomonadales bacterium]|nr:glycosyltransferase family 1 protein [Xanthomonadales bacterium]